MRVIIPGNPKKICDEDLSRIAGESGLQVDEIFVGGVSPLGQLAQLWAARLRIPCWYFEPQVGKYRRLAYMMMDRSMVSKADGLILIWDGCDGRCRSLRFLAKQSGLQVYEQIIEKA